MIVASLQSVTGWLKCTMGKSASMHIQTKLDVQPTSLQPVAAAAWHSLFWLAFANAIGVLLAILLLLPGLNSQLGEWTYGRWMMVHMNLELYGWASLPLVGFLFRVYGADRGVTSQWCRPVLWVWSSALSVGAYSWLSGQSSGKLFLDWSGYARVLFPLALLTLWLLLVFAFISNRDEAARKNVAGWAAKLAGLLILLAVPVLIYVKSGSGAYPAVNPDSGGPTGASQLESSLAVVLILLALPFGITRRSGPRSKAIAASWIMLAFEAVLCALMQRGDISHHHPAQYLSLASLLIWLPLVPAYYSAFNWQASTRKWRSALMWWWGALVITGWIFFLPGVLDHFKFTDGLVGHSFVAMAGFASSLLIFAMVQMLGDEGWIFNSTRSFWLWNGSVVAYVVLMTIAGWLEGSNPAFTIVPGIARTVLYVLRLVTGILMLLASLDWLTDASKLVRQKAPEFAEEHAEVTA
jgi:cytochrome c oxidase cbb3-type subunit I